MGAGTIAITRTLDQIKVVLDAISGVTSFQGFTEFDDSANLEQTIKALTAQSQAYVYFWLKAWGHDSKAGALTGQPTVEIPGFILINVAKNTSSDLNTAIELVDSIKTALLDETNFTGSGATSKLKPLEMRLEMVEVGMLQKQGILMYGFGGAGDGGSLTFLGGC